MAITGDKIGPGPAQFNIRDSRDPQASFMLDMRKSLKTSFSQSRRHIGEPNASVAYQAKPGQYER